MPPIKQAPDENPQVAVEKDPEEGIKNLMKLYPETFCSTSVEDIKIALADSPNDTYKINFNLWPKKYVTHQGMTIFHTDGVGGRPYITRNPLIVKELEKAGYDKMMTGIPGSDTLTEEGTPFANPVDGVDRKMPYIANFLKSKEAVETSRRIEINEKVASRDKDAQYLTDDAFQSRFGMTKDEWNTGDKTRLASEQI